MLENKLRKWIRTPKELVNQNPFLKATPIKLLDNNRICFSVQTVEGRKQVILFVEDSFQISNESRLHDDMIYMNVLNQPQVLSNLVERYKVDKIFTYIGPTLIVINPFKYLRLEFGQDQMMQIRENILNNDLQNDQPHIFMVAGKAYLNMKKLNKKQAIVISGESGAGKTQSTKYCMKILTSLSHSQSHIKNSPHHSVQEMILSCNPLLQAFGNSKTSRNNNSSRFGKYIQIYFGHDYSIKGASVKSYLLQKSRVVSIANEERTFHVFYALIASGKYGMMKPDQYKILNKSGCFTAGGIDDADNFDRINEAMDSIQFEPKEQEKIWLLLKAILELGNIEFDDKPQQTNEQNPCKIINRDILSSIAGILEMGTQSLETKLLKEKKLMLKQTIFKAYKKNGCEAHRNTLCKAIYNSIFEFILEKINLKLQPKESLNQMKLINILDIFGFQAFQENGFEQLCINFTNEKLLKLYNEYIFKREMELLIQDELQGQISKIKPPTNDEIIQSIQGRGKSIFSIINDTTRQPPYTDQNIMNGIQSNYNMSKTIGLNIKKKMVFTIKHSQSPVEYNVQGFKMKNLDKVNDDIAQILNNIYILNCNRQGPLNSTLLNKFQNQINVLIKELSQSNVHFIRCIKPNQTKQPNFPVEKYILTQMRYLGVFQTIQIRKAAFPVRIDYTKFAQEYQILFPNITENDPKIVSKKILMQIKCQQTEYMIGKKRIYLNPKVEALLNHQLQNYLKIRKNELATKLQQVCRRFVFASKVNKKLSILKSIKKLFVKSSITINKIESFLTRQSLEKIKSFVKPKQKENRRGQMIKRELNFQRGNINAKEQENIKPQKVNQQLEANENLLKKQSNQKIQMQRNHKRAVSLIKEEYNQVISSLSKKISELKEKQMKLEKENAELKGKQRNYLSELKIKSSQNEQTKRENKDLKKQYQNLKSQANQNYQKNSIEHQNLTEKCNHLQQQLNQKQTILRRIQSQLDTKMRENQEQIQFLRAKLQKLESEIKIYEKKQLQDQNQIKNLMWQLDKKTMQNRQLQQKMGQKQELIVNSKSEIQKNQNLIKKLQDEIQVKNSKQQQLQREKDELQRQNKNLKSVPTESDESRKVQELQSQLAALRAKSTSQQNQIKLLLNQKAELLDKLYNQRGLRFEEEKKNMTLIRNQQALLEKDKIISQLKAQLHEKRNQIPLQTIFQKLYTNSFQNQNNNIYRQSFNVPTSNNNELEARRRHTFVLKRTQNTENI